MKLTMWLGLEYRDCWVVRLKERVKCLRNAVLSVAGHADFLTVFFEIRSFDAKMSLKVPPGGSVSTLEFLVLAPE